MAYFKQFECPDEQCVFHIGRLGNVAIVDKKHFD